MKALSIKATSRKELRAILPVIAEFARENDLRASDALLRMLRAHPEYERLERQVRRRKRGTE